MTILPPPPAAAAAILKVGQSGRTQKNTINIRKTAYFALGTFCHLPLVALPHYRLPPCRITACRLATLPLAALPHYRLRRILFFLIVVVTFRLLLAVCYLAACRLLSSRLPLPLAALPRYRFPPCRIIVYGDFALGNCHHLPHVARRPVACYFADYYVAECRIIACLAALNLCHLS